MIDVKIDVVTALEGLGYQTYYEAFIGSDVAIPALSYMEVSDVDDKVGDTIEYSDKIFQIKIWSKRVSEISTMATAIDAEMKTLGFRRIFADEFPVDGIINKVLRYRAKAKNFR